MIKFKLNGKAISIASSWDDLTLKNHIGIIQNKDGTSGEISILTGIPIETLKKAKIEGLDLVIKAISFLKKSPEFSGDVKTLGKYTLPLNSKGIFDIQFESLAQFEDMKALRTNLDVTDAVGYLNKCAQVCAIYVQKIRDGEYDYDTSLKMLDEVYNMPSKDVVTAGSFFFLKLMNLLTGTDQTYLSTSQSQKKSKPVSKNSKINSARTRPSRKSR